MKFPYPADLGEIARPLPHGLVKGVPNLVVCPEGKLDLLLPP